VHSSNGNHIFTPPYQDGQRNRASGYEEGFGNTGPVSHDTPQPTAQGNAASKAGLVGCNCARCNPAWGGQLDSDVECGRDGQPAAAE